MQITLDPNFGAYYIRSYKPGQLQINDKTFSHSLILTPNKLIETWPPQSFAELTAEDLRSLLAVKTEIVLLGTGDKLHLLPAELTMIFYQQKIGIEFMDTHAACRTYNVLISEGRNVAAGLLIN